MAFDWNSILVAVISLFAGGGVWQVIRAKIDKEKTPYDMLLEMLNEQKEYYTALREEFAQERAHSAEKSHVIVQSQFCLLKYKHPDIICPVDKANNDRLSRYCQHCKKEVHSSEKEKYLEKKN